MTSVQTRDIAEAEKLISHLLGLLPSVLQDEDEDVAEALRRDAELEANPEAGISLEAMDRQIRLRQA